VTDDHPSPEMLDRLLAGASTSEESTRVLAHLVRHCETCSRYVRDALARAGRPPGGLGAYDQAFAGSLRRSSAGIAGIHADQLEATALWATLEGTPGPLRGKLIANDPRYHTWALASRFLDAAAETHWQDSPGRGRRCHRHRALPGGHATGVNSGDRRRAETGCAPTKGLRPPTRGVRGLGLAPGQAKPPPKLN
jgi:hypothetical protein